MTSSNSKAGAPPHSASSPQVEDRLRSRHIAFTFEPNLRIDSIVDAEGNQVRLIEHRAPVEMVARFAEQMKAGAAFPAIVVNDRGELIDGNTRRLAALKVGKDTISAYICSDVSALQARSLSVELNQCHGLSMTEPEIRAFVSGAIDEGQTLDTKTFARMTGIAESKLSRWMSQATFQQRAAKCGIAQTQVASLTDGSQVALHSVRLAPVLKELTALAADARVSVSDLRALVVKTNAAQSETDALAIIAAERQERGPDIRAAANGFLAKKSQGRRSAMHIGALLRLGVDDLLDVAPDKQQETVDRLRRLQERIGHAVSQAQARWGNLDTYAEGSALGPETTLVARAGA
jgi:hypothetical protein